MNNKERKKIVKQMIAYIDDMSDGYRNLFKWWYEKTMAGIEPSVLADSQIEMCYNKAKELYEEDKRRKS